MKIPKRLKIGGHIFEVEYPYQFKEREDIDGRTIYGQNKILLAGEGSQSYLEQVFWHEVFHVIDRTYCCEGLGLSNDKESIIEGLAQGLLQVLKDNFEELRCLTKE